MEDKFTWNEVQNRYELHRDNHVAFANVRRVDTTLFIDYVEAPAALRGTGAAGKLMEYIMKVVRKEGLTVRPICGYAVSWIKRHSDVTQLLS